MLRFLATLVGLVAGSLAYYAWRIEPFKLVIRRRVFEVEGLDPSAGTITVLHISDLHMRAGEWRKARMLEPLKELCPDLVFITGDFVQSTGDAPYCATVLRGLEAKYGVIGVLGNHDHYRYSYRTLFSRTRRIAASKAMANNARDILRTLEGAGVRFLVNSSVRLDIHGQEVWLVGVDDPYHHRDRLDKALQGVPDDAVRILLAHSPDIIDKAAEYGIGLIFAGHTHGGQVRFPIVGALVTRTRKRLERPSGIINRHGTITHISQGIGAGTLTLRFLCPPEATIIELRPAEEDGNGQSWGAGVGSAFTGLV